MWANRLIHLIIPLKKLALLTTLPRAFLGHDDLYNEVERHADLS